MQGYYQEKPPWKLVEWVKSPFWSSIISPTYGEWIPNKDESALTIKEQIHDLDKEHKWELAKKMVNPYELVYTHDDERLPPSISLEFPLSRSFFKMVEILYVSQFFSTLEKGTTAIRSAHVAEGPGGFIQALQNRTESKRIALQSAIAMTLKPTNQHVPGWKKATQFLQKYKQVKIHYGVDGTGDIYLEENQKSFIGQTGANSVNIFTADGGFDFSVDYSLQEQRVFHLLICSATIGLRTLKKGGQFVLKLFDCTSPNTKTFILLLSRCFYDWTLYKPAMTRPCNSERYFIGRGFRGINVNHILQCLLEIQVHSANNEFPLIDMSNFERSELDFLEVHIRTTTLSQIDSIRLAIHLIDDPTEWWKVWYAQCLKKSLSWCEQFNIPYVSNASHTMLTKSRFASIFSGLSGLDHT